MIKKKKISYISEESELVGDKLKKLKEQLKECQKEKEEYLTQAQRARADLINYRRRQERVMEELRNYGQANFIKELLPVLDSLEMGAKENEGVKQIRKQLEIILKNHGLEEIKALGEKFNPEFHEVVGQLKSKEKEGTIIEEVQKGYILGDKVLRASKVRVAK
jgi:molecular chaperone GrpE